MSNILLRPPKRVDVQNLVGIDSAVTDLRMREKRFCVDLKKINISIYLSIYLSACLSVRFFLRRGYRTQFWGDFNA